MRNPCKGIKLISLLTAFAFILQLCPLGYNVKAAVKYEGIKISAVRESLAVKGDGSLWTWGSMQFFSSDRKNYKYLPVKIMDGVITAAAADDHCLAVKYDGSLWAWGKNNSGQIGDGTTENKSVPLKVMDGVTEVAAENDLSFTVKYDGSLWAWGDNSCGSLGDGTNEMRETPVWIMDGVKSISVKYRHVLALKYDGSLWSWGDNSYGQVGNGTKNDTNAPVKIMTGVKKISAGAMHSLVIKEDGSLWAWGDNTYGQLGDGSTKEKLSPVKIISGVKDIAAGNVHSMALMEDKTLWTWGRNYSAQLGNGTKDNKSTPVKVMKEVSAIAAGAFHSMAVKEDKSLWVWGDNQYSQLGDGTLNNRSLPVKIMTGVSTDNIVRQIKVIRGNNSYQIPPVFEKGVALVSLKTVLNAAGAKAQWNEKGDQVNINLDGTSAVVSVGSSIAVRDGIRIIISAIPRNIGGSVMVPVWFMQEVFGCREVWLSDKCQIDIYPPFTFDETIAVRHFDEAPLDEGPRLVQGQDVLKVRVSTDTEKVQFIKTAGDLFDPGPFRNSNVLFSVYDSNGKIVSAVKYSEAVDNLRTTCFALMYNGKYSNKPVLRGKFDRISYINLNNPVLKFINEQQGLLADITDYLNQSWSEFSGKADHIYSYDDLKRIELYKKVIEELIVSSPAQDMAALDAADNATAVLNSCNDIAKEYIGKKMKDSPEEIKKVILDKFGTVLNIIDWTNFTVGEVITLLSVQEYNQKLSASFTSLANNSNDVAFREAVKRVNANIDVNNNKLLLDWANPNVREAVDKLELKLADTGANAYISYISGITGIAYGVFNSAISISGVGANLETKESIEVLNDIQSMAENTIVSVSGKIASDYDYGKSNIENIELLNKALNVFYAAAENGWSKYLEVLNQELLIAEAHDKKTDNQKDKIAPIYNREVFYAKDCLKTVQHITMNLK